MVRAVQRLDWNCRPLSVTIVESVPNRETHPWIKALATSSAVMPVRGIASGHRVNQSTQVNK